MLLLIADSQTARRQSTQEYFAAHRCAVSAVPQLEDVVEVAHQRCPELVLMEWPEDAAGGEVALAALRDRDARIPVIVTSGDLKTATAVACLRAGADDYVRRPFDLDELHARVQALSRRNLVPRRPVINAGPVAIDDHCKRVTVYGAEVSLSPKEYQLLQLCAADPGRVFSHEEIVTCLWPERGTDNTVDIKQYVHLLRSKLGKVPQGRNLIENVKGFGYRLAI
jgi:DNA-binding response OmpR family regulator